MTRTDERWERNAEVCRCCGQPLPFIRLGVELTPLKARLFDAVQRGGEDGIPVQDLADLIWGNSPHGSLKSHVWQINDLLEDQGFRIEWCGNKNAASYRLVRVPLKEEAICV